MKQVVVALDPITRCLLRDLCHKLSERGEHVNMHNLAVRMFHRGLEAYVGEEIEDPTALIRKAIDGPAYH